MQPTAPSPTPDTPEPMPAAAAPAPLRRRPLFELPPAAQRLLLALSWQPTVLRSHTERVLARQHRQPVVLEGSDADVLASLLHDLRSRNPLSEALHRQLAERHRLATLRVARLRGLQALQQAWHERPANEPVAATLWALLTHPQGALLDHWLPDEAQVWVFAQVRQAAAMEAAERGAFSRDAALQAKLIELQTRLQRQQAQADQRVRALETELAELRGRLQQAPITVVPRHRVGAPAAAPRRRLRAEVPVVTKAAAVSTPPVQPGEPAVPSPVAPGIASPTPLQGQQVLCVGGIRHAVSRYRQRIESLGGRFEHHDGGIEHNPHALQGGLARADLVICQAGCINHAAYHRIKQHCQRTGKPCVYLERASLARFDRALMSLPRPATSIARALPAADGASASRD